MTRLMSDNPTISAHISLLAESERNGTLACFTAGAPVRIEEMSPEKGLRLLTTSYAGLRRCGPCTRAAWSLSSWQLV
jgi:hypothetical protein